MKAGAPGITKMGTQIIGKFLCRWIDDARFAPIPVIHSSFNDPGSCRTLGIEACERAPHPTLHIDGDCGLKPRL